MIKRDDQARWSRNAPHSEGEGVTPTSGQPFVRLESVSKSYGSGSSKLDVLDGLDLDLPEGETTSLVGRSGTGKSTLLSLIAGLMRPDTGHISIGGQQMDQLDDDARANLRADRIGFVLQSDNLIPFLTAVENVELAIGFASGRPLHRTGSRTIVRPRAWHTGWIIFRGSCPAENRSEWRSPWRWPTNRTYSSPTRSSGNSTPRLPRTSWK